jgi:predicted Zn-dependent protease
MSPSTVFRPRPRSATATSGNSGSTRYASAATSTASFSRQNRRPPSERNARETVASFRRLTLEEIQAARPLRIKVITVQPGDTVESLSHRMAGVDRPAERFRVLNGMEAHARVRVRDRVKIVVD